MPESATATQRRPHVAVLGQHEWLVRSLESILASHGFDTRTLTGSDLAPDRLALTPPDLVVLEADPPDVVWKTALASLRETPGILKSTPILVATAEPLTREKKVEAIRAGAWDVFSHPLDAEMLVLKAKLFTTAKMDADDARDRGLVDPETDLYNVRGVLRRIYEEASEATRHRRPLACLVTAVERSEDPGEGHGEQMREIAQLLRRTSRSSDIFGRLGPNEFVVIAPGTDTAGARRLAQRLTGIPNSESTKGQDTILPPLQAGFAAVGDLTTADIEPVDLFVRAVAALRAAQARPEARIHSWD